MPKLKYDHILLFVNNEELKDSLDKIFTPAEKLTSIHTSQGTQGYYYLFYNTYIELLFLTDSAKAHLNQENFGSNYIKRWEGSKANCPVGFGMMMTRWDSAIADTGFHKYISDDSPEGEYYLMSHYNVDASQPLIYVSQPHRAYQSLQSLDEVNLRPKEIREDLRNYLIHNSGVKALSHITYSSTQGPTAESNLKILDARPVIKVESSATTTLTMMFDGGNNQQKEFVLNDNTRLLIKY